MSDTNSTRPVVRVSWRMRPLLFPLVAFIRLWLMTLRMRTAPDSPATVEDYQNIKTSRLVIFWHNRLLISAELHRRFSAPRRMNGLVSASKDGSWLAAFFIMLGIGAIRGSSSRRGGQAILECSHCLHNGEDLAITPDGPRGPCYGFKSGPALLAQKTGVPVVLVSSRYHKAKRLGSWDGFYLPAPFSRVDLNFEIVEASALAGMSPESAGEFLREKLLSRTDDTGFDKNPASKKNSGV